MGWEAELMQQILASHDIPARVVNLGLGSYMGVAGPAELQVPSGYQWTALLLLSSVEQK